jgi:hypothetical protein
MPSQVGHSKGGRVGTGLVRFRTTLCTGLRNSHCAGTSAGAPLSLIKSTRNFAGWVPLAFRSTT